MSSKISDRMSGMIDHGFYATILAVARHLGVSYRTAQKALRRDYLAGDLKREWVGRHLVYTAKQLSMFGAAAKQRRRGQAKAAVRTRRVDDTEKDQGSLF